MSKFQNFITKIHENLTRINTFKRVQLVLGNESGDLDSTVSALGLAYFQNCVNQDENILVLPIVNVEAKLFPLRKEICYVLNNNGIDESALIFRDQIKYPEILNGRQVETILVDHHVLATNDQILYNTVTEIIDHRPINQTEICQNKGLKQNIHIVGSCATLIAEKILKSGVEDLDTEVFQILYAAIIYDTIGLDKDSGRTYDEDLETAIIVEKLIEPKQSRKDYFNVLWRIYNDTSSFTSEQLLHRDLKIVQGIPIPGVPMLVEDFLKRKDAICALQCFALEYKTHSIVLVGIDAGQDVKRDIAIYSTSPEFTEKLLGIFESTGSELLLRESANVPPHIRCFRQGNIKLTRKFILPLVNAAGLN